VGTEETVSGGKIVKVSSNVPDKLPNFTVYKYSGETELTVDEVIREVKLEINENGFFSQETGINYPPTGTLQDEVSKITGDISGKVYGENSKLLSNALVEIVGAKPPLGVLTDASGKYSITNLDSGSYVFKCSSTGYENQIQEIQISNIQGESNYKDFSLSGITKEDTVSGETSGNNIYNTAQTDSQTVNTTGGTTDTININYQYSTIAEPIKYSFEYQNLPPNAPNNNYTSILLVVTNNKGIPPATITIGPIEEEGLFQNYIDLSIEMDRWKDEFNSPEVLWWDDQRYPGNVGDYRFEITNNAGLPAYDYQISTELLKTLYPDENTEDSINLVMESYFEKEYNRFGIIYPPEGAQFFTGSSVVEESTFIITGNTAADSNLATDTFNNAVGSVEANISIDQDVLNSGLSGVTGDLKNDLSGAFSFNFNPDDVGLSNREYLDKYLKPVLNAGKRALVAQIIKMIFGPKEIMSPDPEVQEKLLNSASCGEKMYSLSNNPSVTEKELEFNRVELKKQLEAGKIELTVSCQKVEIKLPENFEEEFDLQPSIDSGVPESQRPNPAESFVLVENYIKTEMQRQRNEEDANEVKKSFIEIMVGKIMQYISVAFAYSPEIGQVFNVLNVELTKTGQEAISPQELLSSPCEITAACKSENKKDFEEKSSFSRSIINSLYSLVLSMLIKRLISEAKSKIKKLIQEKAKEKILKIIKKQKERFKFLSKLDGAVDKAQEYKDQVKGAGLKDIFSFIKKKEEDGGEPDESGDSQ